jgi:hypothetical protein
MDEDGSLGKKKRRPGEGGQVDTQSVTTAGRGTPTAAFSRRLTGPAGRGPA